MSVYGPSIEGDDEFLSLENARDLLSQSARHMEGRALLRDGSTTPTNDISWGEHRLTNLGLPQEVSDAANRAYVDLRTPRSYYYLLRCGTHKRRETASRRFRILNANKFGIDAQRLFFHLITQMQPGQPRLYALNTVTLSEEFLELDISIKGPWADELLLYCKIEVDCNIETRIHLPTT